MALGIKTQVLHGLAPPTFPPTSCTMPPLFSNHLDPLSFRGGVHHIPSACKAATYALPFAKKPVSKHPSDSIYIYSGRMFMTSLTKLNMPLTNCHDTMYSSSAELVTVAILFSWLFKICFSPGYKLSEGNYPVSCCLPLHHQCLTQVALQ